MKRQVVQTLAALSVSVALGGVSSCQKREHSIPQAASSAQQTVSPPAAAFGTVAVGDLFGCAVTASRKVVCWGENALGQLGSQGPSSHDTAREVEGLTAVVQVTASGRHACARMQDGKVRCWGENSRGQTGEAPGVVAQLGASVAIGQPASDVSTSSYESCAVAAGTLSCWGDSTRTHESAHAFAWPVEASRVRSITTPASVVRVASAARHLCVLTAAGQVSCRGENDDGQLHGVAGPPSESFLKVPLTGPALDIGTGDVHSCALLRDGGVACWGGNGRGELGVKDRGTASVGGVPLAGPARSIAVGADHACALLRTGAVQCWGWNLYFQIGASTKEETRVTTVPGLPADVVAIACGGMLSCARARDSAVYCWGATSTDDMFGPDETKRVRRISGT